MKNKNSLLKKIIVLFIAVLTPLIIFSSVYLHQNNLKQKAQALSTIQMNNDTYIDWLDGSLSQLYTVNLHILNQNPLQNLAVTWPSLSPYEKSTQINILREQLSNMCLAFPFVESAHAYLFDSKIRYNSPGYSQGSFENLTEGETAFYRALCMKRGLIQYYQDPLTQQKQLSVIMAPYADAPVAAVNLILSQKELKKYLSSNVSFNDDFYLFEISNGFQLSSLPEEKRAEAQTILNSYTEEDSQIQEVLLDGEVYFAFFKQTSYAKGTYVRFISSNSLMPTIHYSYYLMILFFLLIAGGCILFFIGVYRLIHKPFTKLTEAFSEVEQGNFQLQLTLTDSSDFAYLYHGFNEMTIKLGRLIDQEYNQALLLQKAELKQLQAQINPHFLYNSLFMLQRMIKSDPEEASEVASALGSSFRYITKNSMDTVMLQEEYEHVHNYCDIQGRRFEGRIRVELNNLPDAFRTLPVPKLILQPILENAFNYGVKNKVADGLIRVCFDTTSDSIAISTEDNGEELSEEALIKLQEQLLAAQNSGGIEMSGILNIQRRLNIFSDYRDSLSVSRSSLGGLCVNILLKTQEEVL